MFQGHVDSKKKQNYGTVLISTETLDVKRLFIIPVERVRFSFQRKIRYDRSGGINDGNARGALIMGR